MGGGEQGGQRREMESKIGKFAAPNVLTDEAQHFTCLEEKPENRDPTNPWGPLVQDCTPLSCQPDIGNVIEWRQVGS